MKSSLLLLSLLFFFSCLFTKNQIYGQPIKGINLFNILQINTDGFGNTSNRHAQSMASFKGKLYVGTANFHLPIPSMMKMIYAKIVSGIGGEIWEYDKNREEPWQNVVKGGSDNIENYAINQLKVIDGYLYALTANPRTGMEVWRSEDGKKWDVLVKNGFKSTYNSVGMSIISFKSSIYIGTSNFKEGAQIWRSQNGLAWENVALNGFGNKNNTTFTDFIIYKDHFYVGVMNKKEGMSLYRSLDGDYFENLFTKGLTKSSHRAVAKMVIFQDKLYLATMNWKKGFSIFMSDDGLKFNEIVKKGITDHSFGLVKDMIIYGGRVFLGTYQRNGLRKSRGIFSILSSHDGENWVEEENASFSNLYRGDFGLHSFSIHDGKLYLGTASSVNSCKVYESKIVQAND